MDALSLSDVTKTFTMHLQGGLRLPVLHDVSFTAARGQCVVLIGPSGAGKSSILKLIYGNYRCDHGHILVATGDSAVDIAAASPREILAVRQRSLGYVTQFLRAVPRVSALDIVAEPLIIKGVARDDATMRAAAMLKRFKRAGTAMEPPAGNVFRRRAAAHQSGARPSTGTSDPPAR